ncbi:MAG TPA: gliding motility-associated C-terminal domain-containing protein [Saprospiraceae bacterium]|nr:gliding motility-associated C-terminal domain-containing protein [Saprospiraceae bacterium]HNG06377.1 gliding motility-associated C-terminal domain-containing protein [Saprospiraceae bacterium]HNJ17234.1 gliding motility-associated C-terminal domain-containing protein [Saprospiraceae bacterium]HNJ63306.1 gliding motility-associated C-terminal domain-containing protein [Saprospiraceae bacterium]HNL94604.1 gliding motility-associated C-terminal domain-containing protein [Saprospiraceae bacteri
MNTFKQTKHWVIIILLIAFNHFVYAEGSVDFLKYPGKRMFYNAEQTQQLKVFAKSGEFINFGASHVGITEGFIQVYTPDGKLYAVYDNTGATEGFAIINNNIEEFNGPTGGGSLNGNGYKPGIVAVESANEGVWTFVLGFPKYSKLTFPNLNNTDPWTRVKDQPTIQRCILAWDITVSKIKAANEGGEMLKGRVYSNEYISIINQNGNYSSPKFFILSPAGFIYRVDLNDTDPWGFPISSNNIGLTDAAQKPIYKSLNQTDYTRSADPTSWTPGQNYFYDPQAKDLGNFINNKVFINLPSDDMPANALVTDVFRNETYATWLNNSPQIAGPKIDNLLFKPGNPTGNGCPPGLYKEGDGGVFSFDVNLPGSVSLQLDLNNDGDFNDAEDKVYFQSVKKGNNSLYWNGTFGNGAVIPAQSNYTFNFKLTFRTGEIHIMMADIENNPGGVNITRINGPNSPANSFYYDHTAIGGPVSGGGTPSNTLPTSIPFTYSSNFGNEKMLDYWSYIEDTKTGAASFTIDKECNDKYPDTDGDGIPDNIDLDDDNDGIADYLEFCNPDSSFVCLPGGLDPSGDADGDFIPNYLDANDPAVANNCPDINGDGICDKLSEIYDTDGDGVPNHLDLDSDNDGISDLIESGYDVPDANGDGRIDFSTGAFGTNGFYVPLSTDANSLTAKAKTKPADTDKDGKYDAYDRDSDNDGIFDLVEAGFYPNYDGNNDGALDNGSGFSPPAAKDGLLPFINPAITGVGIPIPPDTDNDGVRDYLDRDSDNDAINDVAETYNSDPDNDGVPGEGTPQVDVWGVPVLDANGIVIKATSAVLDSDGDGKPNFLDLDSDKDGISDVTENKSPDPDYDGIAGASPVTVNKWGQPMVIGDPSIVLSTSTLYDKDKDGVPNYIDLDSDGDMIADEIECSGGAPCADSDNDGITDVLDLDSDNDGIYDIAEYGYSSNDLNNDGVFDGNNNPLLTGINGFPKTIDPAVTGTTYPARPDHDGDGIPDVLDLDSDNDGTNDVTENHGPDPDKDGQLGLGPVVANSDGVIVGDATGATLVCTSTLSDKDKDGVANLADLDSDNDGIADIVESNYPDIDKNGTLDIDPIFKISNFGQVLDISGKVISGTNLIDTDGDGVLNQYDLDSDNDGAYDISETDNDQYDSNGDGMIDNGAGGIPDVGTNGYADFLDPAVTGTAYVVTPDFDGDGVADYLDLDSDNDGIKDVLEFFFYNDADNDGRVGLSPVVVDVCGLVIKDAAANVITYSAKAKDHDGDGQANFRDHDSDNDGLNDVNEAGYADPDGDGIVGTSAVIVNADGIVVQDNNGAVFTGNLPWDHDGDLVYDFVDLDSDGDGIADYDECPAGVPCKDFDDDLVPDIYDLDSDNDGLSDLAENGLPLFDGDLNGRLDNGSGTLGQIDMNGIPLYVYPYMVNGKLPALKDFDGDGVPDFNDLDSDNDGINDVAEHGLPDPDNDGVYGNGKPIVDVNGIPGGGPFNFLDTDKDGYPNSNDLDTDGDGILDTEEANIPDTDHDGIAGTGTPTVNKYGQPIKDGNGNPITGTSVPFDFDGDGLPDFRDLDSDNDGIDDDTECGGLVPCRDTDGDGSPDFRDLDSDGDDLPDEVECPEGAPCPDPNMNGIPEWIEFNCNGKWIPVISNLTDDYQICTGKELILNAVNNIPVPGNIIYTWTGPNNLVYKDTISSAGPFSLIIPNVSTADKGFYTLTLLTEKGCTDEQKIYVNIGNNLTPPVLSAENAVLCKGEPLVLQATPFGGQNISYVWYKKNADGSLTVIDSTSWPTLIISETNVQNNTEYLVKVDADGCQSTLSNVYLTVLVESGIDANDDLFKLEHNPGTKQFDVLANDITKGNIVVKFSNIPSNLTVNSIDKGLITIDFPADAQGSYNIDYTVCSELCPELCESATLSILVDKDSIIDEPSDTICDFIPNVFTPNSDGNNDAFFIPCLETYKINSFSVFNRWGNAVYEKENYANDWKGTYRNNPLPAGTYYYVLTIPELKKNITGFITIIR